MLTPLVLLSNLCFGWMYEWHYVPLLPLLGTAALFAIAPTERMGATQGLAITSRPVTE